MTDKEHKLIHLKEQLNIKMQECWELSKRIDDLIDEMVSDGDGD